MHCVHPGASQARLSVSEPLASTVRGLGPLCSESDRVFAFTVDYPFFSARSRQSIKSGSLMGLAHKRDCAVAHVLVRVSRD